LEILKLFQCWWRNLESRIKVDDILFSYFSEIELLLPPPTQMKLCKKLMEVRGFPLLYFYIYIMISTIYIKICLKDSYIDYEVKRNMEIVNWDVNVVNGILDLKRNANLKLVVFFHS
jgi:hypothetical protein